MILLLLTLILLLLAIILCVKKKETFGGLFGTNRFKFTTKDNSLCLGSAFANNGQFLTFQNNQEGTYCDVFDTTNDELIGTGGAVKDPATGEWKTRNFSVAAYYNGDQNGRPLEYTNKWRGQRFKFDQVGVNNDGTPYGLLRHLASGKCLHPEGGLAKENKRVVVWGACLPEDRIMFLKHG